MKEIFDSIFSSNIVRVVLITLPFLIIILDYIYYKLIKIIRKNSLLDYYNYIGIDACVSCLLCELSMEFNPSILFIEPVIENTSSKILKIDSSQYKGDKHSDINIYIDENTKRVEYIKIINKGLIEFSLKTIDIVK